MSNMKPPPAISGTCRHLPVVISRQFCQTVAWMLSMSPNSPLRRMLTAVRIWGESAAVEGHREQAPRAVTGGDQVLGLDLVHDHGLFQQDVQPRLHARFGLEVVVDVGRDDEGGVQRIGVVAQRDGEVGHVGRRRQAGLVEEIGQQLVAGRRRLADQRNLGGILLLQNLAYVVVRAMPPQPTIMRRTGAPLACAE
ncbi:MAG: hypothetical protein R2851_09915 [Caldilineaceae bacterium]